MSVVNQENDGCENILITSEERWKRNSGERGNNGGKNKGGICCSTASCIALESDFRTSGEVGAVSMTWKEKNNNYASQWFMLKNLHKWSEV